MTMMSTPRIVGCPPKGDPHAKICFVGEAPGAEEMRKLEPFIGPAGHLFEQALHGAGMFRGQCYITNLIKHKITSIDKYFKIQSCSFTPEGQTHVALLAAELRSVRANVVVTLGLPACAALLGQGVRSTKVRGYVASATEQFNRRKVLPTLHPASCMYGGNFINIHYITHDFLKAVPEMEFPEIRYRPISTIIPQTFQEAKEQLELWRGVSPLGIDIETTNYEISCMGFSTGDGEVAISIALGQHYSDLEELELWNLFAEIIEAPTQKVIQNHMFDVFVLADKFGIRVGGEILDTMVGHSIVYPDFLKSQAFLASIYDNVGYWKNFKFDNIKDDS